MKHSIRWAKNIEDLYTSNPLVSQPYSNAWRHSFNDWFLVPEERFSIVPPDHKEATLDIPGGNGFLDYSEALTGYPLYKYREGALSFKIMNDRVPNERSPFASMRPFNLLWTDIYRDICMFLHGKRVYMLLEDDPEWFYYGRFTVDKYDASDGKMSTIKISYKLEPFKNLSMIPFNSEQENDWYWDILQLTDRPENNNIDLYIPRYVNLDIEAEDWTEVKIGLLGEKPTIPEFIFSNTQSGGEPISPLQLRFRSDALKIKPIVRTLVVNKGLGTFVDEQIVFSNVYNGHSIYIPSTEDVQRDFTLEFKGQGTVSINYEIGVI